LTAKVVLRKTSLVDYPGLLSSVIFFYGCNLRCPWCYNGELALGLCSGDHSSVDCINLEDALAHIEKRRRIIGGVVLSGGEPTLYKGLAALIVRIKALNLKVKLDTNGMRPDVLERLFFQTATRPDYIAMDLKIAPERYEELLPACKKPEAPKHDKLPAPGKALRKSAALVRASGIAHEFRSLALPENYFGPEDRAALAPLAGDSLWHIRPFIPGNCLENGFAEKAGSPVSNHGTPVS
jgi:pyruvate formate lyase activating enzyme